MQNKRGSWFPWWLWLVALLALAVFGRSAVEWCMRVLVAPPGSRQAHAPFLTLARRIFPALDVLLDLLEQRDNAAYADGVLEVCKEVRETMGANQRAYPGNYESEVNAISNVLDSFERGHFKRQAATPPAATVAHASAAASDEEIEQRGMLRAVELLRRQRKFDLANKASMQLQLHHIDSALDVIGGPDTSPPASTTGAA